MKYGVIFDMDGVLVQSNEIIWNSHNKILGRHGVHLSPDDIKLYLGQSLKDQIAAWNERYNLSLDLASYTPDCWQIQLKGYQEMQADPYLIKLMEDLKLHDIKMAVGTSSQRLRAETLLELF